MVSPTFEDLKPIPPVPPLHFVDKDKEPPRYRDQDAQCEREWAELSLDIIVLRLSLASRNILGLREFHFPSCPLLLSLLNLATKFNLGHRSLLI